MANNITLITGGQRSGKSAFAEKLTLDRCANPAYIATAQIFDDEMRQRVAAHQARRGPMWTNFEAPLAPGELSIANDTALIDCLTMWTSNILFAENEDPQLALRRFTAEWQKLISLPVNIIAVTNEIGLGGVSANALQRKFTDLQGAINQLVAAEANEVYMLISGIPLRIK